jgi:pimeloyl-ACP methyl ester carboxylesterase
VAVLTAIAVALGANTIAVDSKTRAAAARSGGTVMDGPGHSPMVEAPERVLALIKDFVSRP